MLALAACRPEHPPVPASVLPDAGAAKPVDPAAWPSPKAVLTPPVDYLPRAFAPRRIFVDAGHGAPGNKGTVSVSCEEEQVYTLRVAQELAARLTATGAFVVKLSRAPGESPSYQARVDEATAWKADALLSLHMDARGAGLVVNRTADQRECYQSDGATGFAVLWSDEAAGALATRRHQLATALAARMTRTGFSPYDGADYPGLYENDAAQAGVFLDRHSPGRRVWLLRAAPLPVVILETHHSWHFEEHARWKESRTLDAFGAAVAAALVDFFTAQEPVRR